MIDQVVKSLRAMGVDYQTAKRAFIYEYTRQAIAKHGGKRQAAKATGMHRFSVQRWAKLAGR